MNSGRKSNPCFHLSLRSRKVASHVSLIEHLVGWQSAGVVASATGAMQLLPIIVIIGAPIVSSLTMFFGGK
jgi:hypothetical protein